MKMFLLLAVVALLAGCGSDGSAAPPVNAESMANADRVVNIFVGKIIPTTDDYAVLDIAPEVGGVPSPDGVINLIDAVAWTNRAKGPTF